MLYAYISQFSYAVICWWTLELFPLAQEGLVRTHQPYSSLTLFISQHVSSKRLFMRIDQILSCPITVSLQNLLGIVILKNLDEFCCLQYDVLSWVAFLDFSPLNSCISTLTSLKFGDCLILIDTSLTMLFWVN